MLEEKLIIVFSLGIPNENAGPKTLGYTITKLRLIQLAYYLKSRSWPDEYKNLFSQRVVLVKSF